MKFQVGIKKSLLKSLSLTYQYKALIRLRLDQENFQRDTMLKTGLEENEVACFWTFIFIHECENVEFSSVNETPWKIWKD
jgi:hypothetical protein